MKKIFPGAAFVVSLLGWDGARAADLPTAPAYTPPVAAAVYNWTGFYIGANGGLGWGNQDPLVLFGNRFDRTSMSLSGGMFGGTVGAQIQQGYVVLGVEGDLDWANIKGNYVVTPTILGGPVLPGQTITLNVNSNISSYDTVRLRAGAAFNNLLLYTTGGVALVNSSAAGTSVAGVACGTLGVFPNCSASAWRPGFVVGLGLEYGLTHNWSVKAEYLFTEVLGTGLSTDKLNILRGGINFRF